MSSIVPTLFTICMHVPVLLYAYHALACIYLHVPCMHGYLCMLLNLPCMSFCTCTHSCIYTLLESLSAFLVFGYSRSLCLFARPLMWSPYILGLISCVRGLMWIPYVDFTSHFPLAIILVVSLPWFDLRIVFQYFITSCVLLRSLLELSIQLFGGVQFVFGTHAINSLEF